jgi:hypothetical protein
MSKKLSPQEYELLTQTIYNGLIKADGVENIDVCHNKKIVGRSGAKHQIDVYWEHKVGGKTYKTLIECKHYRKNVSIGRIRDFYGVLQDTGATGIFVTKVGFQSGAQKFASHYGIDLKLVKPTEEKDLEGRIRTVELNLVLKFVASTPPVQITNFKFAIQSDIDWLRQNGFTNLGLLIHPTAPIYDSQGKPLNTDLGHLMNEKIPTLDRNSGGPYNETIKFGDECVEHLGRFIRLGEMSVTYHVGEFAQKTVTDDALDIYTHILKDYKTGQIDYMQHRDGGGKKG